MNEQVEPHVLPPNPSMRSSVNLDAERAEVDEADPLEVPDLSGLPWQKGRELEEAFERWIRSTGRYFATQRNVRAFGEVAHRPYEVDVLGVRYSLRGQIATRAGAVLLTASAWVGWLPGKLVWVDGVVEWLGRWTHLVPPGSNHVLVGVLSFFVLAFGISRRKRYCWIECKNQKTPVKRWQVQKLHASVIDVRKYGGRDEARWTPREVTFVSRSGFDADALALATEYDIDCYERSGDGFVRVSPGMSPDDPIGSNRT